MSSPQKIWEAALGELQVQVSKPNFETWLKDTKGISFDHDIFTIGTPSTFVAEWLESRLLSLIKNALAKPMGKIVDINFVIQSPQPVLSQLSTAGLHDGGTSVLARKPEKSSHLNPRFTFDTFISGESNHLAFTAAREVAQNPGQAYNPLFIYSDTGLGKTHLLQAIGHELQAGSKNVLYTSAEQLTIEFVNSLKNDQANDFNQKYREIDVLLLDDFQFFSGKKQTQICFFHLFNHLHSNECQIVITCDCHPKSINALADKLCSRLEWGLIADIKSPDYDTRLKILNDRVRRFKISVPNEVLEFIATQFRSNIRELEGGLNRVLTYARFNNSRPDKNTAIQALASLVHDDRQPLTIYTPKLVIEAVASYYDLTPDALTGKRRDRKTTLARQMAMYIIREYIASPLTEIGRIFNKDHTTVLYGCSKIASEMSINEHLSKAIETICSGLKIHKNSPT